MAEKLEEKKGRKEEKEKPGMKQSKQILLLIFIAVFVLIAINIGVLFGLFTKPVSACYKDACIYGKENPVQEFKDLVSSSNRAILVAEGDVEKTQRTSYIDLALAQLAGDFNQLELVIVGIGFSGGEPVNCECEEFKNQNFIPCPESSVEYCQGILPDEDSLKILLKYPGYPKNEVWIDGRTVEVRGKTGPDVLAIVYMLRGLVE